MELRIVNPEEQPEEQSEKTPATAAAQSQVSAGRHVVRLVVENFKRIVALDAELDPAENVVEIRGANGSGKSSALDAIAAAIGGQKLCPPEPITHGADRARVEVQLEDLRIIREWERHADGEVTSQLRVQDSNGRTLRTPQQVLDRLLSILGVVILDPQRFLGMAPRDQRAAMLKAAGLESVLARYEAQKRTALDSLALAERQQAAAAENLIRIPEEPIFPRLPDAEPSYIDAAAKLKVEQARREKLRQHEQLIQATVSEIAAERTKASQAAYQSSQLQKQVKACELAAKKATDSANALGKTLGQQQAAAPEDGQVETAMEVLEQIQAIREAWQRRNARRAAIRERDETERAAISAKDECATLDQSLRDAVGKADLPEGLTFGDEGIFFGGVPFEQASQSERLLACVALAMRAPASLRVMLLRDGSILDRASMQALEALCRDRGYQAWVEVVDDRVAAGVVIAQKIVPER